MGKQISIIGAVLWYHVKNSWEEAWVKLMYVGPVRG